MAQLGDFIGALLSDAAQARVRADIEAVKIAESYSNDTLLRNLPVPRFRLPEITVDFPVLISADPAPSTIAPANAAPTPEELSTLVDKALATHNVTLTAQALKKVRATGAAAIDESLKAGPRALLSSTRLATNTGAAVSRAMTANIDPQSADAKAIPAVEKTLKDSLRSLLLDKLTVVPQLQVRVGAADIKAHEDSNSVVRVRVTISEDSYELVDRGDAGEGFSLVPE